MITCPAQHTKEKELRKMYTGQASLHFCAIIPFPLSAVKRTFRMSKMHNFIWQPRWKWRIIQGGRRPATNRKGKGLVTRSRRLNIQPRPSPTEQLFWDVILSVFWETKGASTACGWAHIGYFCKNSMVFERCQYCHNSSLTWASFNRECIHSKIH